MTMAPDAAESSAARNDAHGGIRFPEKLHMLLDSTEKANHGHIISWLPDGASLKVHDKHRFTSEVLPVFFGTSKYKSFQRNLNLWGFYTVSKGPCKGECSHPLFKRGLPQLCRSMGRVAVKGTGSKRPVDFANANVNGTNRLPADISTLASILTPQQQAGRSSGAAGPILLADLLRQQAGTQPTPSHHEQQQAVAVAAATAGPNPLQLAMLQRLSQGNMGNNNNNLDMTRLFGLQHGLQQQASPAQQQLAMLLGAANSMPGGAAAISGVATDQHTMGGAVHNMGVAAPNLAALLQMFPTRQPDPAAVARNNAMANQAAIMSLMGVSAVSRVE
jgi:hypothetical protein